MNLAPTCSGEAFDMGSQRAWLLALSLFLVFATPTAFATSKANCAPIAGFSEFIADANGIVVGDMHGTTEAPKFLEALICNLITSGRPVVLALEYPRNEQRYLDSFLGGASELAGARKSLLASPFWARSMQDGRTSAAMLEFLTSLRERIKTGDRIRVIAYDD